MKFKLLCAYFVFSLGSCFFITAAQDGYESPTPNITISDGGRPVKNRRYFRPETTIPTLNLMQEHIQIDPEFSLRQQFINAFWHGTPQEVENILVQEKQYRSCGFGANTPKFCDDMYLDIDGIEKTPLMLAIQNKDHEKSKLYIDYYADLHLQDKNGNTALHHAVNKDNPVASDLLLKYNANPNIKNNEGKTPLLIAAQSRSIAMFIQLLDAKADPNCQDNFGQSPLHILASTAHEHAEIKMNQLLQRPKINIDTQDACWQTAAHKSVLIGTCALHILKKHGANFTIKDCHNRSALDYAIPMQRAIILEQDTDEQKSKKAKTEL